MRKRDTQLDIMRGIGIVLIMIGHVDGIAPYVVNLIYQFHVPLFFFISGSVFFYEENRDFRSFFVNKIKRLYFPYVFWNVLFILSHNVLLHLGVYSSDVTHLRHAPLWTVGDYLKAIINVLTFGLGDIATRATWFLTVLFETTVIFYGLRFFVNRRKAPLVIEIVTLIFVALLFIIGCITSFPRRLSLAFIACIFFYFGYANKRFDILNRIPKKWKAYLALLCVLLISTGAMYNKVDMNSHTLGNPLLFLINANAGIILVYLAVKKLKQCRGMLILGQHSLTIMCTHYFVFYVFERIRLYFINFDWLYIILILMIAVVVAYLIDFIKDKLIKLIEI